MTKITARPKIMDIVLYEGGASTVVGKNNIVKLSSNENPYGPSDAVIKAIKTSADRVHRYPCTDHVSLRIAIAEAFGLWSDNIICGVGSDEIITFLCQAFSGPGDEVIHTEHGFAMYKIAALAAGATPVEVSERERITDVDAIIEACNKKTKLVFIANPNNPTGTMVSEAEIARLADGIPKHTLLVLDGAYAEYVEGFDGGARLVHSRDNVVMTRTFSKLYGLGGMRVGWGYGPKYIIDILNRVRGPFNLSTVALEAAKAAVGDKGYVEKSRRENTRLRSWLAEALAEHGVVSDISMTNFILARFASQPEAEACDEFLKSRGLIVRRVGGYNLPNCLRITIGDESACRRVAHSIGEFKAAKK